ncbi:hypothetical protein P4S63_03620 [Pseudoalteromonas sp. B193]
MYSLIDDGNDSKAIKFIDTALDKKIIITVLSTSLKRRCLLRLKRAQDAKDF